MAWGFFCTYMGSFCLLRHVNFCAFAAASIVLCIFANNPLQKYTEHYPRICNKNFPTVLSRAEKMPYTDSKLQYAIWPGSVFLYVRVYGYERRLYLFCCSFFECQFRPSIGDSMIYMKYICLICHTQSRKSGNEWHYTVREILSGVF